MPMEAKGNCYFWLPVLRFDVIRGTLADRLNIYRHLLLTSSLFYVLRKHVIFFTFARQLWSEGRGRLNENRLPLGD